MALLFKPSRAGSHRPPDLEHRPVGTGRTCFHRLNEGGCKFLEADLCAAVALDAVSRLGHKLQSLGRNVKAATGTLPVRAVPDPYQRCMHASKLRLHVPTTVFRHLMLLVLVHKSKTTDRAVHLRTAVRAIHLFKALRQFSFELQKFSFRGGQWVVVSRHNYSPVSYRQMSCSSCSTISRRRVSRDRTKERQSYCHGTGSYRERRGSRRHSHRRRQC
jgi:hypothetical protein